MSSDLTETPGPALEAATREVVCPECGQSARVTLNRRAATDFCTRCDFPLFWIPSQVLLEDHGTSDSLRRLPGAVGRQSVGTSPCPTCAEQNLLTAESCIRCGGPMRLPVVLPEPAPPPPAPEPEPVAEEEPPPSSLLMWLIGGLVTVLLLTFASLLVIQLRG